MTLRDSTLRLAVLFLLTAVATAPAATAGEDAALDPVVRDVVRMLEEGVNAKFIRGWLLDQDARPVELSADDLIALSKANAPEEIIQLLMEDPEDKGDADYHPEDDEDVEPPSQGKRKKRKKSTSFTTWSRSLKALADQAQQASWDHKRIRSTVIEAFRWARPLAGNSS